MADVRRNWPSDAFDAIAVIAIDGEFEVEVTDGPEVILEGSVNGGFSEAPLFRSGQPALDVQQLGRWLRVQSIGRKGEAQLHLQLPRQKAWVFELAAARGDVRVRGVQARMHVGLAKGDVVVQDARGVFAIKVGKGAVKFERCTEAPMPERPPVPHPEPASARAPGEFAPFNTPWEAWHGCGPESHWPWRGRMGEWLENMPWQEWLGDAPWQEWLGMAWERGGQFLSMGSGGVSLYLGKGEIQFREINANTCQVGMGSGGFRLQGGRYDRLQVRLGHGDVECNALPAGQSTWSIDTNHGDIELGLPGETEARLDVATRHGSIRSDFPLVRASRPGPEARHGGRRVGAIGRSEQPAQISLSTMRGDITIRRTDGGHADRKQESAATSDSQGSPVGQKVAADVTSEKRAEPMRGEQPAPTGPGDGTPPVVDTRLAILESLSRGEITVEEAARLLERVE